MAHVNLNVRKHFLVDGKELEEVESFNFIYSNKALPLLTLSFSSKVEYSLSNFLEGPVIGFEWDPDIGPVEFSTVDTYKIPAGISITPIAGITGISRGYPIKKVEGSEKNYIGDVIEKKISSSVDKPIKLLLTIQIYPYEICKKHGSYINVGGCLGCKVK